MIGKSLISLSVRAAAVMVIGALAMALPGMAQQRGPLDPESVRQKVELLVNLVTNSVSARTIESGSDAESKAALARARALVATARQDMARSDHVAADAKLNEALALVNAETRKLSAAQVAGERAQDAYDNRLRSVRAFLQAYERVAAEKGKGSAAAQQQEVLARMVADAEAKARDGRYAEAKDVLDTAYHATRKELRELRAGDTLVRSLNFAAPKDEYEYEIDRNDSHVMLLKIAAGDQPLAPPLVQQVERLRADAAEKRRSAERQAGAGDYKSAIRLLEQSTASLLQAIRASGLYVPG